MTKAQINEVEAGIECLYTAREHLDKAMYRMGIVDTDDLDYKRVRKFYDAICKALDIV